MALVACVQALLLRSALAFDSSNRLVDYRDRITVYNSTDPDTVTFTMDLMSFPYMTDVSSPSFPNLIPLPFTI